MNCRNCGNQIDPMAAVCVHCGVAAGTGNRFAETAARPRTPAQPSAPSAAWRFRFPYRPACKNPKSLRVFLESFSAAWVSTIFISAIPEKQSRSFSFPFFL